jgi:DNA-binding transcriptional LysR family regulator
VPTPRAIEMRDQVSRLVPAVTEVLRPAEKLRLSHLVRTFTIRTSEGFVESFGPALIARTSQEAPGVRLHFKQKSDKESTHLREGTVDLETGVVEKTTGPELRVQPLFKDKLIGTVRSGHPLSRGRITPSRFTQYSHVLVSRQGFDRSPIDEALESLGLTRQIATVVGGFATALGLARASDLVASVPERHTVNLREGMHSFVLPVATPTFTISLLWHPRLDADAAHRWLRSCIQEICTQRLAGRFSTK